LNTAVVVVAAGRGTRAGGDLPKQFADMAGRPVLAHTLAAFQGHPSVGRIVVVIHPDDRLIYDQAIAWQSDKLASPVPGGATRQASVLAGLEALATNAPDLVLIHDAARPFVDAATIDLVIAAIGQSDGALAALPVADTLKRQAADGTTAGTVERAGLWRAQTPQGFRFARILSAHRQAADAGRIDFTDDAAVAEWAGIPVKLVPGSEHNIKITTAEDLAMAAERLTPPREIRTGQGFDVHRFRDGDHVWLCGVRIPHDHSLEGHSDADVGLHALTDALLGTIGDGDIGQHFPPSDPKWKGAASYLFLADAARRVRERGGRVVNVDVTLLCEAPRIGPHRVAMAARVAEILGLTLDRVGIKATTTEQLGFTGRREGIAALAIATVSLPER
jgi:2-C-methyl-D-erythritol 4-phosphate cytidylyltransferase/2-C-methyl-D-erythritol 2,4-cyclodiphosphate synthase